MDLKDARRKYAHLDKYLRGLEGPAPTYYAEVDRSLKDQNPYNLLYHVSGPYFVHLLDDGAMFPKYIAIQPSLHEEDAEPFAVMRDHLFHAAVDRDLPFDGDEMREAIQEMCTTMDRRYNRQVPETRRKDMEFLLHQELAEHGLLEPLMKDPWIEDIHGLGTNPIMLIHKVFDMLESNLLFESKESLDAYLVQMGERMGRPVSGSTPIVDGALPNGSRINIVYSDEISRGGSSFTIRKFSETPIAITQLIAWGTMDARLAAYLWLCLEYGMSVFVSGETASGKTTSLNAMLPFIRPQSKILTAEDTPEVLPPHANWQQLVTRERADESAGQVSMYDLLKAGLRSRPNCIIVGEIRGAEGGVAFQAMQTGHPTMATFHASSVNKLIQRFTSDPINVPEHFMGNLNVALIQMAVHVKGRMLRRVLAVEEIEGYSKRAKQAVTRQVFNWDSVRDDIRFMGRNNSYVLETLVAPRMRLADPRDIYEVLDRRTRILEEMVERQIFDYDDVASIMFGFADKGEDALPFRLTERPREDAREVAAVAI